MKWCVEVEGYTSAFVYVEADSPEEAANMVNEMHGWDFEWETNHKDFSIAGIYEEDE